MCNRCDNYPTDVAIINQNSVTCDSKEMMDLGSPTDKLDLCLFVQEEKSDGNYS